MVGNREPARLGLGIYIYLPFFLADKSGLLHYGKILEFSMVCWYLELNNPSRFLSAP